MTLDPRLVELLACPKDKGPLLIVGDEALYNPRLRLRYRIDDGIPVMLVDEATELADAEHDELMRRIEADGSPSTLRTTA